MRLNLTLKSLTPQKILINYANQGSKNQIETYHFNHPDPDSHYNKRIGCSFLTIIRKT